MQSLVGAPWITNLIIGLADSDYLAPPLKPAGPGVSFLKGWVEFKLNLNIKPKDENGVRDKNSDV